MVFPLKVTVTFLFGLSFHGIFGNFPVIGEFNIKILATKISQFHLLHCYNQVTKIVTFISDYSVNHKINFPYSKRKISCEHSGTQVTRANLSRHRRRCSSGTLYCTQRPNFTTLSQDDLKHRVAKKHSVPRPSIAYKCKLCHAEFPGFYALRQHKSTQHGPQIGFGASKIDVEDIVEEVDDQSMRE